MRNLIVETLTQRDIANIKKLDLSASTEDKLLQHLHQVHRDDKRKDPSTAKKREILLLSYGFKTISFLYALLLINSAFTLPWLHELLHNFHAESLQDVVKYLFWGGMIILSLLVIIMLYVIFSSPLSMLEIDLVVKKTNIVSKILSYVITLSIIISLMTIGGWLWGLVVLYILMMSLEKVFLALVRLKV